MGCEKVFKEQLVGAQCAGTREVADGLRVSCCAVVSSVQNEPGARVERACCRPGASGGVGACPCRWCRAGFSRAVKCTLAKEAVGRSEVVHLSVTDFAADRGSTGCRQVGLAFSAESLKGRWQPEAGW